MKVALGFLLMFFVLLCGDIGAVARQEPPPPPAKDYTPKLWKEFSPQDGAFTVLLPGAPEVSSKTEKTEAGELVTHTVSYRGVIAYDVIYMDCPINVENPSQVKKLFDHMRDGGLANVAKGNPRIVTETDFSISGHPGRFLLIEVADNTVIRMKFIAVKNRVYNLIASSEKARPNVMGSENDYQEIATTFLDSFKLTKF